MERGLAYSCSTSGPGCSHEPCDRSRRKSSRSAGDHRSHRRIHLRSHHRSGGSCVQCVQLDHTCNTPGHRQRHRHRCSRRQPGGIHAKCGQHHRSGSRTSPWELQCTLGLLKEKGKLVDRQRKSQIVQLNRFGYQLTDMALSYELTKGIIRKQSRMKHHFGDWLHTTTVVAVASVSIGPVFRASKGCHTK